MVGPEDKVEPGNEVWPGNKDGPERQVGPRNDLGPRNGLLFIYIYIYTYIYLLPIASCLFIIISSLQSQAWNADGHFTGMCAAPGRAAGHASGQVWGV